jgi:hypothetical protein
MLGDHLAVEHAVVDVANQHEVVRIVREFGGPHRVSARTFGRVRYDVSDVGRVRVRGAGNLVPDEQLVAARVLTATGGAGIALRFAFAGAGSSSEISATKLVTVRLISCRP